MIVKYNNLGKQYEEIRSLLLPDLDRFLQAGQYVLGEPVKAFEDKFAKMLDIDFCVGVSNGTDAIKLAVASLNLQGSTVIIVQDNTYISTVLGALEGAPKGSELCIVDMNDYCLMSTEGLLNNIGRFSSYDNKIIIVTHMFGQINNMTNILQIAKKFNAIIIEDCAQAHLSTDKSGRKAGTFGELATFSFYPGKNLGACGDAGAVVTKSPTLHRELLRLRNLGQESKNNHVVHGYNHRLDSIQALILSHKLDKLEEWTKRRQYVASQYLKKISNAHITPIETHYNSGSHTYHVFPVRSTAANSLKKWLTLNGIEWMSHYPLPVSHIPFLKQIKSYHTRAYMFSQNHVSLPIHSHMTEEEISYVCDTINKFEGKN